MAAILSDISDDSDTNFIYTVSERMSNATTNTLKQSLFTNKLLSHVTKAAETEVFLIPKKWERPCENKSFS